MTDDHERAERAYGHTIEFAGLNRKGRLEIIHAESNDTFWLNMSRDYCDITRAQAEVLYAYLGCRLGFDNG